jgi:CheY-like chemotaxis protein
MKTGVSGAIRVLHVDDAPDFAAMTAEFLEREDDRIEVETAGSAQSGLERLSAEEVDCIVSDYDMPGQNGLEFLMVVREEYSDLPFIPCHGEGLGRSRQRRYLGRCH